MRLQNLVSLPAWRNKIKHWSDTWYGVDFMRIIEPEEVGLDPTLAVHSSPSGDGHLKRALAAIGIAPGHKILDIGCGTGSAMRTMLKFPFARVDGIELSDSIAELARSNFRSLRVAPHKLRVFASDATAFNEQLDEYTHIYMYNPFHAPVMKAVAENLRRSLDRKPRALTVIYRNPVCHDELVGSGAFDLKQRLGGEQEHRIHVYHARRPQRQREPVLAAVVAWASYSMLRLQHALTEQQAELATLLLPLEYIA